MPELRSSQVIVGAVCAVLMSAASSSAQISFPNYPEPDLPTMGLCQDQTPVEMPEQWEANAVLSPYLYEGETMDLQNLPDRAPLTTGRFVYDATNGMMRGTLVELKSQSYQDLLITPAGTYVLVGDYANPTCIGKLSAPLNLPGRVWQDPDAQPQCVGEFAVPPHMQDGPTARWWKQLSPISSAGAGSGGTPEAADWYWVDENGYPMRTMFWGRHGALPAFIGEYAFTNFSDFRPGNTISLPEIAALCSDDLPVIDPSEVMAEDVPPISQETEFSWVEGLSYSGCASYDAQPPSWPMDIYATSFSTAAKYATPRPLTTSVTYRASDENLRTRLHELQSGAPIFSDALLLDDASFGVNFSAQSPYAQLPGCGAGPYTSLPAAPHNNWGERGSCQCQGVLEPNTVLNPKGVATEIISCPMPLIDRGPIQPQAGNTLFWMWYTITDPMEPVVFMQTQPNITVGTGLSLADYYHWEQKDANPAIFQTPTMCTEVPLNPGTNNPPPANCMGCHNVSTNAPSK